MKLKTIFLALACAALTLCATPDASAYCPRCQRPQAAPPQVTPYQGPYLARTPWWPLKNFRRGVHASLGRPVAARWWYIQEAK
jgi:hypothetical protein